MKPVYLSSIGLALGDETPLSAVDDDVLQQQLAMLHDQGLKSCRVSDQPAASMAAAAARQTLRDHAGHDIDAIVYCTDTAPDKTATSDAWDFLLDLGRPTAPVSVVGGAGCGNLVSGLSVARNLVLLGQAMTVLVVTTDRVKTGSRYLDNGQTALSDGAASCLVSAHTTGPAFALRGLSTTFRVDIGTVAVRPVVVARATTAEIRRAVRQMAEPLGAGQTDFARLLTGHYARSARAFLAMSVELPADRVYCPSAAEVGHAFAADHLISLAELARTGEISAGENVLILAMSPRSWSVAAVTYVEDTGACR